MRDTTEVDIEELIEAALEYWYECVRVAGRPSSWRWVMHPRVVYEIAKIADGRVTRFGNPPMIPYGKSDMQFFGLPITISPHVEDIELEEVG